MAKPALIDLQKRAVAAAVAAMNAHDAKAFSALFAADGTIEEYGLGEARGREAIANGLQKAFDGFPGDRATGEAYTMAHHLTVDGAKRNLMIAALRYADTFVKKDGEWLFAERKLYVDWIEQREMS